MDKTGGPAFPVHPDNAWRTSDQRGMTLRDYFAAHAPDVWHYFDPIMPDKPAAPTQPTNNNGEAPSEDEQRVINDWNRDPAFDLEDKLPLFSQWADAVRGHYKAVHEWERERDRQRLIQWPWFYADTMISQRQKGV